MIERMLARLQERLVERHPAVNAPGHYLTLDDTPGPERSVWWVRLRNGAGRIVRSWGFGPGRGVGIRAVSGISGALRRDRAAEVILRDLTADDPRPLPLGV